MASINTRDSQATCGIDKKSQPLASSVLLSEVWYWKSLIIWQYEFSSVISAVQQIVAALSTIKKL